MAIAKYLLTCMSVSLGLIATSAFAAAAPPRVSGTYAFMAISFCQAEFSTTEAQYKLASTGVAPAVQHVNPVKSGSLSVETGTIKFTPTTAGASSGQAVLVSVQAEGGTLFVNGSGFATRRKTQNLSGPYSFTDTTFAFNGQTFDMTYGAPAGNPAVQRAVNLIQRESSRCSNAVTATWQKN